MLPYNNRKWGFQRKSNSRKLRSAVWAKTNKGRDCAIATGQREMICRPVDILMSGVMVRSTPFVVKVACRSLTAHNSPSKANHRQESRRCMGVCVVISACSDCLVQRRRENVCCIITHKR